MIFRPIADLEGFSSVPYIVWGDLGAENKDAKAKRLIDYANNRVGILPPEFVLDYAIKSEDLNITKEEVKKYLKKKEEMEKSRLVKEEKSKEEKPNGKLPKEKVKEGDKKEMGYSNDYVESVLRSL